MTNIYLASDLHYEVWGLDGPVKVPPGADIVVIAGDLRGMPLALETCGMTAESTGLPVIFTPGNHEYYQRDYEQMNELALGYKHKNVSVLINKTAVINGIRFLGTPLWSNFAGLGDPEKYMKIAEQYVFDFLVIRYKGKPLTAATMLDWHQEARRFLESELEKPYAGKTVIVTHFPPSYQLCHKIHRGNELSPYFNSVCDELIMKYKPAAWFFGHTHAAVETNLYGTDFYCNQGGYPGETTDITGFNPNKLIKL